MMTKNQVKGMTTKTMTQVLAQRERRRREIADKQRQISNVLPQSNDNRNRMFIMTPEMIQLEILQELRDIKRIMSEKK